MKTTNIILFCTIAVGILMTCNREKISTKVELKNDIDSISYFTGIFTGWKLKELDCNQINKDIFCKAVNDVLKQKKPSMSIADADFNIGWHFEKLGVKQADKYIKEGQKYLDKNKERKGVVTTTSGIQYEVTKEGLGNGPKSNDKVVVKFIVNKDGSISDVKAETKHGYGMDSAAVELIKKVPKWEPALQNNHIVTAYKKQPITFVIEEQ